MSHSNLRSSLGFLFFSSTKACVNVLKGEERGISFQEKHCSASGFLIIHRGWLFEDGISSSKFYPVAWISMAANEGERDMNPWAKDTQVWESDSQNESEREDSYGVCLTCNHQQSFPLFFFFLAVVFFFGFSSSFPANKSPIESSSQLMLPISLWLFNFNMMICYSSSSLHASFDWAIIMVGQFWLSSGWGITYFKQFKI